MKYALIAPTILLSVLSASQAFAKAGATIGTSVSSTAATQVTARHKATRSPSTVTRSNSHTVTYNRDSKDPNIGWHTVNGMRVCTQDCDNPEIPGSGYTCKDVNFLGMPMRECDWSSW